MADHLGHGSAGSESPVTPEVLAQCAQLLADGEIDWPTGLSRKQQDDLLVLVRRFRRAKLVKFIASRIAADIASEVKSGAKEAQP